MTALAGSIPSGTRPVALTSLAVGTCSGPCSSAPASLAGDHHLGAAPRSDVSREPLLPRCQPQPCLVPCGSRCVCGFGVSVLGNAHSAPELTSRQLVLSKFGGYRQLSRSCRQLPRSYRQLEPAFPLWSPGSSTAGSRSRGHDVGSGAPPSERELSVVAASSRPSRGGDPDSKPATAGGAVAGRFECRRATPPGRAAIRQLPAAGAVHRLEGGREG